MLDQLLRFLGHHRLFGGDSGRDGRTRNTTSYFTFSFVINFSSTQLDYQRPTTGVIYFIVLVKYSSIKKLNEK